MSQPLAIIPKVQLEVSRPDVSWIKKHVSVFEVAKALGLRIRHRRATCWRPENHTHGDSEPSLHFYERRNRVRCFVCDMRGGHSNVDLVMGVLGISFGDAVCWIAERFTVPNVKVGRPVGNTSAAPMPYRAGVHGSEWEVIVRSGFWGAMSAAERSILVVLDYFKDSETGITRMSYRAIMRYSGVKMMGNVSGAIKELSKMHALQVSRGPRIGVTRECSSYRVTIDDPKFLELCNAVCESARNEVAQERAYRASQKRDRERDSRKPEEQLCNAVTQFNGPSLRVATQNTTNSNSKLEKQGEETHTCEGLNLSSIREVHANKPLLAEKREISTGAFEKLQRDKEILLERGFLP